MTCSSIVKNQTIHLLVVFKLLQGENVLVKIFLKLLICIVDVELLKAVDLWRAKLGRHETQKTPVES